MQRFQNLTGLGFGQRIAGPMLVLQGTADTTVPEPVTAGAVNGTCGPHPDSELDYAVFNGSDHVPTMFSSQQVWLDWIADRFEGRERKTSGCGQRLYYPAKQLASYQEEVNSYLQLATRRLEVLEGHLVEGCGSAHIARKESIEIKSTARGQSRSEQASPAARFNQVVCKSV
jgi:hypothetical protein